MEQLFPRIDTYHLLIFYYVCQEKSITAAAEKLFLSQPTVTNHIRSLEESLQAKLIRIDRRKLSLTHIGEGLFQYASGIFQLAMAADRFVEIAKEKSLYVGVHPLLVRSIAKMLHQMCQNFSNSIKIDVRLGESNELVQMVLDSSIDLALVPSLELKNDELSQARIAEGVKLYFYTGPDHPILTKSSVKWADLSEYPLVMGNEASNLKQLISSKIVVDGQKTPPQFNFTGSSVEFLKSMVQFGNGISIASEEDLREDLDRGALKIIPLPDAILMNLDVISHKSHFSTTLMTAFVASARACFKKISDPPDPLTENKRSIASHSL